jgi:glycosyltransferase involved in cell wall biosynthesis
MRILLISDHFPPFIGGAHRQTRLLAHQLVARGHDVSVVTVWQPGLLDQEDDEGVTVYRLRQLRTLFSFTRNDQNQQHQPPFPDPLSVWQLRRLINRLRPEVVHSYGWFTYTAAVALWGTTIPLLISVRDYAYSCPKRTLIYKGETLCDGPALPKCLGCAAQYYGRPKGWVATLGVTLGRRLLMNKVRGVHSISSYVQEMTRRDFFQTTTPMLDNEPVEEAIIPSFMVGDEAHVDRELVAPYLRQLPAEPYILFVGALRRVKGVDDLLAAYQRLDSPPPLLLIGTVEHDTPKTFPPGVVVLEKLPHQAVMAAWEGALFGVIPSLWPEPLGSVVYEGMIKGKAVIGSTPGGHTDMIVHEHSGLLVPCGDVDALTEAMRRLLDDPGLRERLARAAAQRAQQFTAAANLPHFEGLYQRLVAKQTRALPVGTAATND